MKVSTFEYKKCCDTLYQILHNQLQKDYLMEQKLLELLVTNFDWEFSINKESIVTKKFGTFSISIYNSTKTIEVIKRYSRMPLFMFMAQYFNPNGYYILERICFELS